jgi:hypothetical protein
MPTEFYPLSRRITLYTLGPLYCILLMVLTPSATSTSKDALRGVLLQS